MPVAGRKNSEFGPFFPSLPFKFSTGQLFHKTMKLEIIWFVLFNFIESPFTYHKTHPCKMYSSVMFSTFTALASHHCPCNLVLKPFHHPQNKPVLITPSLPSLSTRKSLIHFVSLDLLLMDVSYEWPYICGPLWLLSLSIMLSSFIHSVACISTSFRYCW